MLDKIKKTIDLIQSIDIGALQKLNEKVDLKKTNGICRFFK